jgi:hypothetical protein
VIPFKHARRADPTTTKHVERQHKCPIFPTTPAAPLLIGRVDQVGRRGGIHLVEHRARGISPHGDRQELCVPLRVRTVASPSYLLRSVLISVMPSSTVIPYSRKASLVFH